MRVREFEGAVDSRQKLSNVDEPVAFEVWDGSIWVEENGIADAGAGLKPGERYFE